MARDLVHGDVHVDLELCMMLTSVELAINICEGLDVHFKIILKLRPKEEEHASHTKD